MRLKKPKSNWIEVNTPEFSGDWCISGRVVLKRKSLFALVSNSLLEKTNTKFTRNTLIFVNRPVSSFRFSLFKLLNLFRK